MHLGELAIAEALVYLKYEPRVMLEFHDLLKVLVDQRLI